MASSKKAPLLATGELRPKFGTANVLAQSESVKNAFGRGLGFVLMTLALLATPIAAICIAILVRR